MEYVPYNESVVPAAIARLEASTAIYAADYNSIIVYMGKLRDILLSRRNPPLVDVPSVIGDNVKGELVGWTYGKAQEGVALTSEAKLVSDALGYVIKQFRSGKRITRVDYSSVVYPWPTAAVVGEVAQATLGLNTTPLASLLDVDAAAAQSARIAIRAALWNMMGQGQPLTQAEINRVWWMAREYDAESSRGENIALVAIAAASIVSVAFLATLGRQAGYGVTPATSDGSKTSDTAQNTGLRGIESPYGSPFVRSNFVY